MKRLLPVIVLVIVVSVVAVTPVFALDGNPPAQSGIDLVYIGQLLQALTLAIVPVLAAAGARWLIAQGAVAKAQLTQEQQYALDLFVKTVVYAAEQMHAKQYITSKLNWATDRVQEWLVNHKIFMNASEIRANIEAAVYTEFNSGYQLPEAE